MAEGLEIAKVRPGSAAEELGLEAGDFLVSVNGFTLRDVIDYMRFAAEEYLELTAAGAGGEVLEAVVEKDPEEDLGITFVSGTRVRTCKNHCMFCFVDQMPPGFRRTLYVKDDDWQTSFLHGSYITLTNLTPEDISRITRERLSPLYVSVHAASPEVRQQLLGNGKAGDIMPLLAHLAGAGIRIYAQAVIVPGVNDGEVLKDTIRRLGALAPQIVSLAVVPVGLTAHRCGLAPLAPVDTEAAGQILDIVDACQEEYLARTGTRFVFAADELYIRARRPFPPASAYEDFSQIENGVGLAADFLAEARLAAAEGGTAAADAFLFVTGRAFEEAAQMLAAELAKTLGVNLTVHAADNRTFGPLCDVAGLLTGADVIASLRSSAAGYTVLLPPVMFRDGGDVTLDGMSCAEIAAGIGAECRIPQPGGRGFVRSLLKGGDWDVKTAGSRCRPAECR